MYLALAALLNRFDKIVASASPVIVWGSPVPAFGDISVSTVATIGLNPSNREFVDGAGYELEEAVRRLHTLRSLRLLSWEDADATHLRLIVEACSEYFLRNPYDRWFKRFEEILQPLGVSFYGSSPGACHLDLIPYATINKWTDLTPSARGELLAVSADILGMLLRDSPITTLILNGSSVVRNFQLMTGMSFERAEMSTWTLPRYTAEPVVGVSYRGVTDSVGGVALGREILVLGYNHNVQSSFGVTNEVVRHMGCWIAAEHAEHN